MKEQYTSFRNSKWFPLVIGIVSVILGLVCLLNPQIKMESIALVLGVVFLLFGALVIVNGFGIKDNSTLRIIYIVVGAVMVLLAILDFANLALIGKYLPTLFGFFIILCAISNLIPLWGFIKLGIKSWWYAAVPSLVLLVLGFIFLLKPGFVGETFGIFSGIALLVNGVTSLIGFAQAKKTQKPKKD